MYHRNLRHGWLAMPAMLFALILCSLPVDPALAQTCWAYVDSENALAPGACVQTGNTSLACNWDGDCHEDGDPSDCCTFIPTTGAKTVLRNHEDWHSCFGAVGDDDGNNPSGRGQRWYAFHRQFEVDFNHWRDDIGLARIESLEWFPGMLMPWGHFGANLPASGPGSHPSGCGTGPNRPNNVACELCIPFAQCLYLPGGGPPAPHTGDPVCGGSAATFPYASLDQFPNVEEVATVLDDFFHGQMHGATGLADVHDPSCGPGDPNCCNLTVDPPITNGCYTLDTLNSQCSPRDPMFWRLHKALDDVVWAWQNSKAVDVVIAIDRSGSMSGLDANGQTKLEAALTAVENFADLLDHNRSDGQQNRIALVSYSNTATLHLPLTPADPNLLAPGGAFLTAIDTIRSMGPGGCTSIGSSVTEAIAELCPPGDCRLFDAPGDNDRKGILLLTDGLENQPPCLNSAGPSGGGCGTQCFGPPLDYNTLEFTQVVGVGFGNTGSLNGDLLTLLAERQGGIYLQNPNSPGDDLKNFFVKAFGQLTSEFLLLDPEGDLPAQAAATPPVDYQACGDAMLTFDAGWNRPIQPGELQLLVNAPSGALVRTADPVIQGSRKPLWAFDRVRLPYQGERKGAWRAQLIRPHRLYVNGFAPDAVADPKRGTRVIRRQIQRLCPEGCKTVLFYEQGRQGAESVYELALKRELDSGLLGAVTGADDPAALADRLRRERWDLIVYARMGDDRREPYDDLLARLLCSGRQLAILTDTRRSANSHILECAGVQNNGNVNRELLIGDGLLFDGSLRLKNPGHIVFSHGLTTTASIQATLDGGDAGVVARTARGEPQHWFVNVLGQGLSKVQPVRMDSSWKTGEPLLVAARIPPSYHLAGGYDHVDARVEVEYPTVGLGTLLARRGLPDEVKRGGEILDRRAAALAELNVPTKTAVFKLYDDGTHGDVTIANNHWTTELKGIGNADGMYRFRFIFDLTADGCTTRREATQSMFVDIGVDPEHSDTKLGTPSIGRDGWRRIPVQITPRDRFGNLWGPGQTQAPACGPKSHCRLDPESVKDLGDGRYAAMLDVAPGIGSVRLTAFGAAFDLPTTCDECAGLLALKTDTRQTVEHATVKAEILMSRPVPSEAAEGEWVYLASSSSLLASVPESVRIAPGKDSATFPITVHHVHGEPEMLNVIASHAGERRSAAILVLPDTHPVRSEPRLLDAEYHFHIRTHPVGGTSIDDDHH